MKRIAVFAVGLCCAIASPAAGQVWLGQMAGQMSADQSAVQVEFNCRHATPLGPDAAKAHLVRVQKAMTAFLALTPAAAKKDILAVFDEKVPGTRWQDGDDKATLDQIASHLAPPAQAPTLVTTVIGGDGVTSRTIWSGQDAKGAVFYAVDFANGSWLRDAHILDMVITHGAPPETPPAYCHLNGSFVGS